MSRTKEKKFLVKWTEEHEVEVEANDEDQAIAEALAEEWDKTLRHQGGYTVEFLEGRCTEHREALDSEQCCGGCQSEPEYEPDGAA